MKKWNWVSFIVGIVTGALLMIGVAFLIGNNGISHNDIKNVPGLTMLSENQKSSVFDTKSIKIMQTLSPKMALAHTEEVSKYTHEINYYGTLVLYIASDDNPLYDDQIIKIPNSKRLVQVGTYEYETNMKTKKTVPAVSIK